MRRALKEKPAALWLVYKYPAVAARNAEKAAEMYRPENKNSTPQ